MTEGGTDRLPGDVLSVLRETQEVDIETRPAPDVPPHRTTIWVVVDPQDRAFIRTYRGAGSRWYREATASGQVALLADGQRIEVRWRPPAIRERRGMLGGVPREVPDPAARSLAAMLVPEVLGTTLELLPGD